MSKGKIIGKSIQEMIDEIRKARGSYEAKRLERAADEVPNLERLYQREALEDLFRGDNAAALMAMRPGDFESYAKRLSTDDPITRAMIEKNVGKLARLRTGFADVPFLDIDRANPKHLPNISGHEGRHRMRALEKKDQPTGLVRLLPRASIREDLPRRTREEAIEALRKELGEKRLVTPEGSLKAGIDETEGTIALPDVYKQGGPVHKSAGGRMAKSIGAMAAELSKKRAVLPKEEAEANLRKMLESSKVQQRLYHGTTATEGGKGQEAIRRFKPSKEGALGSGSYLTPAPSYASGYADQAGGNVLPVYAQIKNPLVIEGKGDPMIEALIKLGMDEDKASRMVERAYENKGYIGKEVESRARAAGYDGLMQYRDGELSEVVSYNPNAIKSAIGNVGTYDTSVPDLSKAKGGPVHKQDGGSIKASPAKPGQQFLGRLGQVAEKLGIKLEEAMKIVAQEGNSPVKAFLVNMLGSETLKSAGTALQDWTGTPRDATEDYPYRRLVTGKGMTAQFDPRLVDVAPIAGTAASRVAHGIKHLPTDVMRAAMAAYGPQATASPLDVWHGSPHRFKPTEKNPLGQFDPTKIGTGEGNQAYGYGHYVAERPGVAKTYGRMESEYKRMTQGFEPKVEYAYDLMTKGLDDAKVLDNFAYKYGSDLSFDDAMKAIKEAREHINAGNLYKVDLPDEQIAKMLDWDKPLSEQSESVQKVLKGLAERDAKMYGEGGGLDYYMGDPESYSGESVYRYLTEQLSGQPETSSFFKEAGIPGIKYFDAASRDVGEGTRNFVVFPGGEEMLTIKERMKDGGVAKMQWGGIARAGARMAKYGKHFEPSKKTEIFIGEKSPMWDAGAAGKAVQLEKAGIDPVDIWKQTGTFRSPDGALRQEISDVGSKFRGEKEMKELAASMKQQEADIKAAIAESKLHPDLFPKQLKTAQGEVRQQAKDIKARRTMEGGPEYRVGLGNRAEFALEHPELYEAYPLLSGMDVQQGGRSGSALGSYTRGINESDPGMVNIYDRGLANDPRSTMIHEAQHAIQNIEGWGRGGNPITAFQNPEAFDILNQMRKQALEPMTYEEFFDKYKGSGIESMSPSDAIKHYELYKKRIPEKVKQIDNELQRQAAKLYYDRLAGEAEARAAQARIDLTPRQRLENFPLETGTQYGYDVKPEDIIVKREKKGGQVSIDAMRLAVGGMAGGGIRRRGIEEVTKLFEAAQKTRSRAAQEAAGLYHPIGGGIKLSKPIELMQFKTVKDPTVKGVKRKIIKLEDLQDGIGIPLVGDRAAGGTLLTSVEGIPFRDPLTLEAGPDYMLTHTIPGSPESSIWRSGKNVITGLQKQVEFARDTGRPIYGVNVVGAPTNVNYNTMVTEAILNQYDPTALTKKAKKEFLKDIRNYAPDASKPHLKPGAVLTEDDMNDVEALRAKMLADGAGPLRKAFVERMALEPFQKMGFPDVPASRLATTEPLLVDVPTGSAGFTVGTIDPAARALENTPRGHKTYPIALAGEYFGSLGQPIDYRDIFQEFADKRRLLGKPEASDWRSFSLAPQFQTFDQEWLDRIMKSIGATNPREWKKGGAVNKAAGGMASIPQKIMRAFVEAGKKAKLQEKAKEAIAKGETYIPDEETTRIQRELLQGVKKPEELAEGGQITSDDLILEERPL